jgi:hypothetical protein
VVYIGAMCMVSCMGTTLWNPSVVDSRHGTLHSNAIALTFHLYTIRLRTSCPMAPKVQSPGRYLLLAFSKRQMQSTQVAS